jgi:hypothetical protein
MQQTVSAEAPSPTAAGFASLLSSLIAPPSKAESKSASGWNDDDLAEDFATLSYERAMRSHARYHASEFDERPLTQAAGRKGEPVKDSNQDPNLDPKREEFSAAAIADALVSSLASDFRTTPKPRPEAAHRRTKAYERNLKNASITVRLSQAEYEQLQERAAEAGLSVSAYLRSCTFEAESLRAQVKETLAQLRTATAPSSQAAKPAEQQTVSSPAKPSGMGWLGWLKRPWPQMSSGPHAARA